MAAHPLTAASVGLQLACVWLHAINDDTVGRAGRSPRQVVRLFVSGSSPFRTPCSFSLVPAVQNPNLALNHLKFSTHGLLPPLSKSIHDEKTTTV